MTGALYLPHDIPTTDTSAVPDADMQYADVFRLVAKLCDSFTGGTEEFTLWLSTCRNERLTINAIFQDVKEAFCPTRKSSPLLDSILYHLERDNFKEARREIDRLRKMILPAIASKRAAWGQREEYHAHLDKYLNESQVVDRERLRKVLLEVRRGKTGLDDLEWSPEYLELDPTDHPYLRKFWSSIDQVDQFLRAFAKISEASYELHSMGVGEILPELYEHEISEAWAKLLTSVTEELPRILGAAGLEHILLPSLTRIPPGREFIASTLKPVLNLMHEAVVGVEHILAQVFKPVPTSVALPPPYVADLRPPNSDVLAAPQQPLEHRDFGLEHPSALKILVVGGSTQSSIYRHREVDFDPQLGAAEVFSNLAFEALEIASQRKADLLVLPEAFLPRASEVSFCEKARGLGISLIAGVEPGRSPAGRYENYAVFQDAKRKNVERQFKRFPSPDEADQLSFRGGQKLYQRSSIGNSSVIVCSDFQQVPPIAALASSRTPVELLVVTSATSFPELQHQMAVTDSARLHAFVVVANNKIVKNAPVTDGENQAFVARPGKSTDDWCVNPSSEPVELLTHKKAINLTPYLKFFATTFEIDLSDLAYDRSKPAAGMIARPASRASKQSV